MQRSRTLIVLCGFVLILGAQVVFTIVLSTQNGIRMKSPQTGIPLGRTFVASGDVWARVGISTVRVEALPAPEGSAGVVTFAAQRDAVKSRGRTLYLLSSWSAALTLPSDGDWLLRGVLLAADGRETATPPRLVSVHAGTPAREFHSWTPEHVVPILIIVALSVGLGLYARGPGKEQPLQEKGTSRFAVVAVVLTLAMWTNELSYQVYWFSVGGWSVTSALMLQMCGLSILFLPVMLFSRDQKVRQRLFDVLYFWGIGGAVQALIAPDIGQNGFPAYRYFSFFVSHGLIIATTLTMAIAGRVTITIRSFLRAFVVTNLLLIPFYGIDQLLGLLPPFDPGNYFILGYPPPTGSIVDLFADIFGPSPRYVVGLELMGLVVFLVLYAPWPLARLAGRGRQPGGAPA
jgi:hypothetical integral membrane protein (TIGR02206 family)